MKIYAYRGYSSAYMENTMLAFQKAAEAGCDGIQLDLHMSRDKKLVVFHDEAMSRLTDAMGFIRHHVFADLEKSHFRSKEGDLDLQIPAFETYCQWAQQLAMPTLVQLKNDQFDYNGMEAATIAMLEQYNLIDRTILASRRRESLQRIQRDRPDLPTALILDREKDLEEGKDDPSWEDLGIAYLLVNIDLLDPDLCARAEGTGLAIIPYGLKTEDDFKRVEQLDLTACLAADVEEARRLLGRTDQPFDPKLIAVANASLVTERHENPAERLTESSGFFSILVSMAISVGAASLASYILKNLLSNFIPY